EKLITLSGLSTTESTWWDWDRHPADTKGLLFLALLSLLDLFGFAPFSVRAFSVTTVRSSSDFAIGMVLSLLDGLAAENIVEMSSAVGHGVDPFLNDGKHVVLELVVGVS